MKKQDTNQMITSDKWNTFKNKLLSYEKINNPTDFYSTDYNHVASSSGSNITDISYNPTTFKTYISINNTVRFETDQFSELQKIVYLLFNIE
jgi:hypothetical protein